MSHVTTIRQVTDQFRRRQLSPVEWTRALIERVPYWQQRTHYLVDWDPERALAEARAAEARYLKHLTRGPLDGVLVGVKDLIDVLGQRTTAGSRWRADAPKATADAAIVATLRQAGANLQLGKLNLHEYAYGVTGTSSWFGPIHNPFDPRRIAGGSSSGSAVAAATGTMALTVGTDTGGSVRIPAAFCGVYGLKPTYGRLGLEGVVPLSPTLDHLGFLASQIDDLALVWSLVSGDSPRAHDRDHSWIWACPSEDHTLFADRALAAAWSQFRAQLAAMTPGQRLIAVTLPHWEAMRQAQAAILNYEVWHYHRPQFEQHPEWYQPAVRERLLAASQISHQAYRQAQALRRAMRSRYRHLVPSFHVLVLPAVAVLPPLIEEASPGTPALRDTLTQWTSPLNLLGWPALTVPWGLAAGQLPMSLQLVGPPHSELTLIEAARRLERLRPQHPPIVPPFDAQTVVGP
jgi:aspartyl-tRNA(Asn)/glutamyl-tRNA(Gln) amidotransferase subunit A